MSSQIISDDKGNPAGVFIPMPDWNRLKEQYAELEQYEIGEPSGLSKEQLVAELTEAIQELKAVEQGTRQAHPLTDLLDEL